MAPKQPTLKKAVPRNSMPLLVIEFPHTVQLAYFSSTNETLAVDKDHFIQTVPGFKGLEQQIGFLYRLMMEEFGFAEFHSVFVIGYISRIGTLRVQKIYAGIAAAGMGSYVPDDMARMLCGQVGWVFIEPGDNDAEVKVTTPNQQENERQTGTVPQSTNGAVHGGPDPSGNSPVVPAKE